MLKTAKAGTKFDYSESNEVMVPVPITALEDCIVVC